MATFTEFKNYDTEKSVFIQPDQIISFNENVIQNLDGETGEIVETFTLTINMIDGKSYTLSDTIIEFKTIMRDANVIIKEKTI